MYKSIIAMALVSGISATAMANQGSGRINFTGEIIAAPCSITSDNMDQTVSLGQISNTALIAGGTSPSHNFNITLSECNFAAEDGRTANITFTGNTNAAIDDLLAVTGFGDDVAKSENVAIEILDSASEKVIFGTAITHDGLVTGDNALQFSAHVRGADDATAEDIPLGNFNGLANFSIAYN
ncbi:fimbrial protein [Acinetobacter sp. ANC 4558]|uniref:fimbrial protein n=1 Tax=Acinetobacter sp. ANC 4558 TaxID=1977876 RepID=UPI00148A5578|nr:fimbrial protein [Acinetobacter sp. ANC 4558]